MARRSEHSPEELKSLILASARSIISEEGISSLSMRKVSKRAGYTEGTIYQYFENKHDLVLAVNAQTFSELEARILELPVIDDPKAQLMTLAMTYVDELAKKRELWVAIFDYTTNGQYEIPQSYRDQIDNLIGYVELCLGRMPHPTNASVEDNARLLWASVHSVCALEISGKLSLVIQKPLNELVRQML